MADPGFPIGGGADPLGGTDLQRGVFWAETYAKAKELGPVRGGEGRGRAGVPGPPSDNNNMSDSRLSCDRLISDCRRSKLAVVTTLIFWRFVQIKKTQVH